MSADLPPALASALRPVLPELANDTIAAIAGEVPAYARSLEGPLGRALRVGVRTALARFVDAIEDPAVEHGNGRELYVELGRAEFRGGRSLDALLSAYRIGARLAWERFVAAGERAGHEPATLYRLASAIFSYIDGISADSVEGYAQERTTAEGERQRRRRALARLLARDDVSLEAVHDAARAAGWPGRPRSRRSWSAARPWGTARRAARLGEGRRVSRARAPTLTVWPRGSGPRRSRRPRARRPWPGCPTPRRPAAGAQLGPRWTARPASSARPSRSPARPTASSAPAPPTRSCSTGAWPVAELLAADDHLAALMLHGGDSSLAADLAARVLAPLADLRPKAATRMRDTLRAWLDHPGQVQRRRRAPARPSADRPLSRRPAARAVR